jgi:hypothetical protein
VNDETRTHVVGQAMTHAERQARYRTKQAEGVPTFRYRKPADRRSRVQRWHDAIADLQALQNDYQAWLEALPENMADGHSGCLAGDL